MGRTWTQIFLTPKPMFTLLCHSVIVKPEISWYRIPQNNFCPSLSVVNPQETDLGINDSQSPLLSGFWLGMAHGWHQQVSEDTSGEGGEFILLFPSSLVYWAMPHSSATGPVGPSRVLPRHLPSKPYPLTPSAWSSKSLLMPTVPECLTTPCRSP